MTFSKSFPRTLKGSSYPIWEEVFLSEEEEREAELKEDLIEQKYKPIIEQTIKYKLPKSNIIIAGKPDCIAEQKEETIVYDCKTGKEKASDHVQVMIYMHLLSKNKFKEKLNKGFVIYKDKKIGVNLPNNFEEKFNFFVNILSSTKTPTKNPGDDCKFCSITKKDCQERIEE